MSERYARFTDLLRYPLRSGVTVPKERRGSGIPMVNMGELFQYPRITSVEMSRVGIDITDEGRYLLLPGDLLFARRSLKLEGAGQCSIVWDLKEPTTWESSIIRARIDSSIADPRYYFYYFRSPMGRTAIETIVEQVAAAGIRSSDLANLLVPVPPLERQQVVADLLSAVDDKIAVNEQVVVTANRLLDAHFSVVIEKSHRTVRLGEIVDLRYGKALREGDRTPGAIPVFGSNGVSGWHNTPLVDGPGVIVGRKGANAGSVSWSPGPFWPIDTSFYAKLIAAGLPEEFIYFLLRELKLARIVGDSAIPGLNRSIALACEARLPEDEEIARFTGLSRPMRRVIAQRGDESRVLAELRDTLLPKLMSGELRIKDAEKAVEEAV